MTLPATRVRRGHQLRLVIPGPQTLNIVPARRDEKLVALIAEALEARKLILAEPEKSIASIAAANGRCRTRLSKLVGLSCMAPDIVTAIVEGRQSATLTARMLQDIDLPLAWANQRTLLGVN
jgi:site-specific DNA recombinase